MRKNLLKDSMFLFVSHRRMISPGKKKGLKWHFAFFIESTLNINFSSIQLFDTHLLFKTILNEEMLIVFSTKGSACFSKKNKKNKGLSLIYDIFGPCIYQNFT